MKRKAPPSGGTALVYSPSLDTSRVQQQVECCNSSLLVLWFSTTRILRGLTVLNESDALFEAFKQTFPAQLEAAQTKARALADALLTPGWRRLIGPAWKLPYALIVETATSNTLFGPGEHCFSSLEAVARLAGVSERTVQRWLSKTYQGASWLACWVQRRTVYMTREDGLPCRAGTVFRVSLEAKPTHDLTPAPRPRLEALKAPWRLPWELPQAREANDESNLENPVLELKRHELLGSITFPSKQGMLSNQLQVEGRDLNTLSSSTLFSNTRQSLEPSWTRKASASSALFAAADAKAKAVCSRLGDGHSWAFWYREFRRAGEDDGQVWAAVSQGLEKQERGELKKTTAAGYAVGILNRSGRCAVT